MTDTFLDDFAIVQLVRNLISLEKNLPELARIARREVDPPGGRAARNPRVPGSRPPVNLAALDATSDIATSLAGWTRCLHEDANIAYPDDTSAASLARHLARHVYAIAAREWALDCAVEIADYARRARHAVDPPEVKYIGPCQADGPALCRGLFSGDGRDDYCDRCNVDIDLHAIQAATEERIHSHYRDTNGTPMELAHKLRQLGYRINNKQITYWARRKLILKRGEVHDGPRLSPLYNLGEVEDAYYRTGGKRPFEQVE